MKLKQIVLPKKHMSYVNIIRLEVH